MASRQLGKALALDTPIPLPNGEWSTMGELKVGDYVLDDFGNPTKIIAATDVMYDHDCYEIEFDYGDKIIADKDHLWRVTYNCSAGYDYSKILTTDQLFKFDCYNHFNITSKHNNTKYIFKSITKIKSVPVRCIEVDNPNKMYLCGKAMIPTHNSSISACLLAWALNFFPNNTAVILN